jgi:hypothetical protein
MDAERLVKMSRDNIGYLPEHLQDIREEYGATYSLIKTEKIAYNKEHEEWNDGEA